MLWAYTYGGVDAGSGGRPATPPQSIFVDDDAPVLRDDPVVWAFNLALEGVTTCAVVTCGAMLCECERDYMCTDKATLRAIGSLWEFFRQRNIHIENAEAKAKQRQSKAQSISNATQDQ